MQALGFGFGQNAYGAAAAAPSGFNMGSLLSGFGANSNSGASSGFSWKFFAIGAVVTALVALLLYFVIDRADTRPVVSGFKDLEEADTFTDVGPTTAENVKSTGVKPAPAVPSEEHFLEKMGFENAPMIGSTLYSSYVGRVSGQSDALLELQELEAKLAAFTTDLTSPEKQLSASKLVQYNTYQDIRPLNDWTAQCFSKNVPERDITLQMERWFLSGKKTLADLNKAAGQAEDTNLSTLASMIDKVKSVAMANCLATAHAEIDAVGGPRDPTPYAGSAKTDTSSQFSPL
jgi:hypothetical protein